MVRSAPGAPADADIAEVCTGAVDGDQACWDELVRRYTRLVWSVVRGYRLGDADAADVHQTVFLRLVEHLPRIERPASLASWLATTTRNESMRVLRKQGRVDLVEDDPVGGVDPETFALDASLLADERDRALWISFQGLRHRCQELLRLLMADPPVPYDEISAILDIPKGSIGPTRQRCLSDLRSRLGPEFAA